MCLIAYSIPLMNFVFNFFVYISIAVKFDTFQSSDREQIRVHGLMQFVALKKLNRLSHIRSKKAKDATNIVSVTLVCSSNNVITI